MESSCQMISGKFPVNISFTALNSISATCKVTNKIDIGRYFEVLKTECTKIQEISKPRRIVGRSDSSGTVEELLLSSSRRKKSQSSPHLKKRISLGTIDDSISKKENYFNFELSSGQVIDVNGNDNCFVSCQKSLDINSSKLKLTNHHCLQADELTTSYSEGDLRVFYHNNHFSSSKSCESLIGLDERHKEYALLYGKLCSVSEKNRKLRKKYFNERKSSKEKILHKSEVNDRNIEEEFDEKLSLTDYT